MVESTVVRENTVHWLKSYGL